MVRLRRRRRGARLSRGHVRTAVAVLAITLFASSRCGTDFGVTAGAISLWFAYLLGIMLDPPDQHSERIPPN